MTKDDGSFFIFESRNHWHMRLLILGLDGLSWNMLERFDYTPPFLSTLRSDGVSGDLRSVDPPATFPAWTSFATGKDPGSHGVLNMVEQGSDYEVTPCRPNEEDAAVFDFVPDAAFVNLQGSYGRAPAAERTHLIAGKLAPNRSAAVPERLQDLDTYESYRVFKAEKFNGESKRQRPEEYVEHLSEIVEARYRFANEMFNATDPDVGFVLFSTLDWLSHFLSHASSDEQAHDWFTRLMRQIDEYCSTMAATAENVVVVSDHGFEQKTQYVHLNDWLRENGYLEERTTDESIRQRVAGIGLGLAKRSDAVEQLLRAAYKEVSDAGYGRSLAAAADLEVDYPASQAWDLRDGCIYINDQRFEEGTVANPDQLVDTLVAELSKLTGDSGDPVFRDVADAASVYDDPSDDAPDVIARHAPHRLITTARNPSGGIVSDYSKFGHRYDGIFVADGPLFEDSETVSGLGLEDVLPTILHALGRFLSPDFDGDVATEALRTDRNPEFLSEEEVPEPRTRKVGPADETVEERLADLGYIE